MYTCMSFILLLSCFSQFCITFVMQIFQHSLANKFFFLFSPPRIKDEPEDDGYFASPKEDIKPLKRPRDEDDADFKPKKIKTEDIKKEKKRKLEEEEVSKETQALWDLNLEQETF